MKMCVEHCTGAISRVPPGPALGVSTGEERANVSQVIVSGDIDKERSILIRDCVTFQGPWPNCVRGFNIEIRIWSYAASDSGIEVAHQPCLWCDNVAQLRIKFLSDLFTSRICRRVRTNQSDRMLGIVHQQVHGDDSPIRIRDTSDSFHQVNKLAMNGKSDSGTS